jgi:thiamine-monophosphate kinase
MSGRRRGEFELIADLFAPLARSYPLAFGLTDDAAVLAPAPGEEIVVTADALIAGVHFPVDERADWIARKALRVNLSDIAAMGATPHSYVLTIALPEHLDEAWLERFVAGLAEDQAAFGIVLIGGDTVATSGPLALSITMFGIARTGQRLRRNGARPGDRIVVSGTIGDAALGLKVVMGTLTQAGLAFLAERYRLPTPRIALGQRLVGLATAALDVSDGLIADLEHICDTSGVGARVETARVPLSGPAAALVAGRPEFLETVLTGGDDYELLFTLPPTVALAPIESAAGVALTVIGGIVASGGVVALDADGRALDLKRPGYAHR